MRDFLRALAAQGRTVLVSSHLLSEMSQTADHLIVIGKGKLVDNCSTYDFIKNNSATHVVVRTHQDQALATVLRAEGLTVNGGQDEEGRTTLIIPNATTDRVGDLAFTNRIVLHELSLHRASLEEAFLGKTGDAVQYQATVKEN